MSLNILICLFLGFGNLVIGNPALHGYIIESLDQYEFQVFAPECKPGQKYLPDTDCTWYWDCTTGTATSYRCDRGLYWNPRIDECDFPSGVPECDGGTRPPSFTPVTEPTTVVDGGKNTGTELPVTTQDEDPDIDCGTIGNDFIPHPDCTKYYVCTDSVGVVHRCPIGLLWNPHINDCDFPTAVPECIGGTREPSVTEPTVVTDNDQSMVTAFPGTTQGSDWNIDCGNVERGYLPLPDCTKYYICCGYVGELSQCPVGLLFNPRVNNCDFPEAVPECIGGTREPSITEPTTLTSTDGNTHPESTVTETTLPGTTEGEDPDIDCGTIENGYLPHPDCTKYYVCTDYIGVVYRCPLGLLWNPRINECDFPTSVPECIGRGFEIFSE